jgi:uncharacterized protein YijF (DUF1287 family)
VPFVQQMRVLSLITSCLIALPLLLKATELASPASIVRAARGQIGKTIRYDPSYRVLDYPNGDVPMEVGVCSDVIVRALRSSQDIDLQKLVHEDMRRHFSGYPKNWGLKGPDKNIDHRRVPNLQTYFKRMGYELPASKNPSTYKAGDLVTCIVPPNLPHIMIVSNRTNVVGRPLVIHNIGAGTQEEDRLFQFKITGHFRIGKIEKDQDRTQLLRVGEFLPLYQKCETHDL